MVYYTTMRRSYVLTLRLSEHEHQALDQAASRQRCSRSALVRWWIAEQLARNARAAVTGQRDERQLSLLPALSRGDEY